MKHIHYLLGALLLAGGCNDDKTENNGQVTLTSPVALTSEIASMQGSTADSWNDGDQIGVYLFQHGTNRIVGGASNSEYKAAASGDLAAAGSPIRYSSDYDAFDVYAYYPFNAAVTNYILPIKLVDQTDKLATCLLYSGSTSGIVEQEEAVKLGFVHKLAKIAFAITPGAGIETADLAGLKMTAEGLNTQADFNVMTGRISNRRNPETVTATVAAGGKSAQIVTLPDAGVSLKLHFTLKNGLTFDWETDKTFEYAEGKIHNLHVTIGNSNVEVIPGDIEDWTGVDDEPTTGEGTEIAPPKMYAVGDLYPDSDNPVGIVFQISDGGKHGKVVNLTETTGVRWGTDNKNESTDGISTARDADNGAAITHQMISVRKDAPNFKTDYALFNWIYNTVNGSDIDGVWYLPAINELKAVLIAASGLDYGTIAPQWTSGVMPQFDATAGARTAFNAKLTAAKGIGLGAVGATYFTATEKDSANTYCVKMNTGAFDGTPKAQNWQRVRLIRAF